jgi:hypothetical protein
MSLNLVILGSAILSTTSSQSWAFSVKTSYSNLSWAHVSKMTLVKCVARPSPLDHACMESNCLEPELELAQPFLFGLSCIFNQVETYMETIGNERSLLVLDQGGIVALQNGLIAYFTHYKSVQDML